VRELAPAFEGEAIGVTRIIWEVGFAPEKRPPAAALQGAL